MTNMNKGTVFPCAKHRGFSLIELVVVMAIVGILAAVAIPAYDEHVTTTKRLDAQSALVQLSQAMERYYGVNYTYEQAATGNANTGAPAATTFPDTQSPSEGTAAYNLTISASSAVGYTLTATPVGVQATKDTECANLTLNQAGVKGISGTSTVADCW